MQERRQQERFKLQHPVDVTTQGGVVLKLTTKDISIGGICFNDFGGALPGLGEVVSITFAATPGAGYTLKSKVRRLTENSFAVMFIDFGLDDLAYIDKILSGSSKL